MATMSMLDKMQTRRTVLKRTRPRPDLPALALYLEAVAGQPRRKVLDTDGKEHVIDEKVLQSLYKLLPGPQAQELLDQHWPKAKAEVKAPVTNAVAPAPAPKPEAKPVPKTEAKPAAKAEVKAAPKVEPKAAAKAAPKAEAKPAPKAEPKAAAKGKAKGKG